jgi:hypothetical protein
MAGKFWREKTGGKKLAEKFAAKVVWKIGGKNWRKIKKKHL